MPVFWWKAIRIFLCCLAIVCYCSGEGHSLTFECNNMDSCRSAFRALPTMDTIKALVLYATDTLPDWWRNVWNPDNQLSVPRFYKDNSFGKYIITADVYAFGSSDALGRLDDSINFADYDNDGPNGTPASQDTCSSDSCLADDGWIGDDDGFVDAFFYVEISPDFSGEHPWLWRDTVTRDSSIVGRPVFIGGGRSAGCKVPSEEYGVFVPAHEWGHALCLPDLYGEYDGPGVVGWWGLGGFSVMSIGMTGLRAAPFDPWSRIYLKWIDPIEVTTPLYNQPIPDFLTTGTVYKLSKNPQEYFLVTNHRGVDPFFEQRAYWEAKFKGYGLMIWHVDTAATWYNRTYRLIDMELAHGMWDTSNCTTITANPVAGLDSLDFGRNRRTFELCGYPLYDLMSETCFWNDSTGKIVFDGSSNPNSNAYGDSVTPDLNRKQYIPTYLAVQNIRSPAPFTTAQADLIVNAKFGDIESNATWGPGVVSVIGDVRIKYYGTLTIAAGTTVRMQSNYDVLKAGVDTTKCEIIVEGGGALIIPGAVGNPVRFLSSRPESLAGTDDWRGIIVKPGAVFACSNAVIRHAYAGIENSSVWSELIKNVKIGRCKMYGIYAANTDNLTIRGCRIDSINANPGGKGILVSSETSAGPWLVRDTVRACYYGIYIVGSATPVDSCRVEAATGGLTSFTGILNQNQGFLTPSPTLSVTATWVTGYFAEAHFHNYVAGRASLSGCVLTSSVAPYRSPDGIRNAVGGPYFKLRGSQVLNWGANGIITGHNNGEVTDLGVYPANNGVNTIHTSASGPNWKYVYDVDCSGCGTPIIKAEWNQWNAWPPPSNRFSPNVDWSPYMPPPAPRIAGDEDGGALPRSTELYQNYPNPFNPTTLIQFNLQRPEQVHLEIFNILGQKVRTLLSGEPFAAGPYRFVWDGKDDRGSPVSSGMYVYKLQTPTYLQTKKMVLVK